MAVVFIEAGTAALQSVDPAVGAYGDSGAFGTGASVTSDAQAVKGSTRSIKCVGGTGTNWAAVTTTHSPLNGVAGRFSFYVRFSAFPANNTNFFGIANTGGGQNNNWVRIGLNTTGHLFISTDSIASTILATGTTVLALNTDYRISGHWEKIDTFNGHLNVFLDGVAEVSATNWTAGDTPADFYIGWENTNTSTSATAYFAHIYADDSTSLTDPGDIRVTAKRPFANGTLNDLTTQIGSGGSGYGSGHAPQVNERPGDDTNGWSLLTVVGVTEEYTIEGAAVGDVDITGLTLLAVKGWMRADALTGASANLVLAGSNVAKTLTTSPAYYSTIGGTTYPAGGTDIGLNATTANTWRLYECGVEIAYIPPSPPPTLGRADPRWKQGRRPAQRPTRPRINLRPFQQSTTIPDPIINPARADPQLRAGLRPFQRPGLRPPFRFRPFVNGVPVQVLQIVTSGVSVPIEIGTLKVNQFVVLSGVDVTTAVGTAKLNQQVRTTGVGVSVGIGAVRVNQQVRTTGLSVTVGIGAAKLNQRIVTSGVSIATSVGAPRVNQQVRLTGVSVSVAIGTARLNQQIRLTGLSVTVAIGSTKANQQVRTTGLSVAVSIGTPVVLNPQTVLAQGVSVPVGIGTARLNQQVRTTGLPVSVGIGSARVQQQLRLTGVSVTVGIGTVKVQQQVQLTGLQVVVGVGTATASLRLQTSGLSVPVAIGTVRVNQRVRTNGLSVGVAVGNATVVLGTQFIQVTGVSVLVGIGTSKVQQQVRLTSLAVSVGIGTATPVQRLLLSGLSVSTAVGAVRVQQQIRLVGVSVAIGVGTPNISQAGSPQTVVTTGLSVPVGIGTARLKQQVRTSGVSVAVGIGTVRLNRQVRLVGLSISVGIGATKVLLPQTVALNGVAVTVAIGNVALREQVRTVGVSVAVGVGSIRVNQQVRLVGVSVHVGIGTPSFVGIIYIVASISVTPLVEASLMVEPAIGASLSVTRALEGGITITPPINAEGLAVDPTLEAELAVRGP